MSKWIAEFELEDGDTMPEHMDLEYRGARIDFHCKPLEQEPTTKNDLGVDCISRQAVIDKAGLSEWFDSSDSYNEFVFALKELPSVAPQEPRKGHWEHGRELSRVFIGDALRGINYEDWHCSNCHCVIEQSIKPKWNYCPNCGAKMQEVEE